ncbi:MAG: TonB-dependent receptor [Halobacteriovoraceae bacterium]|nr:TonB-dependent receptor [Halobacteriovoraceae bacterium]
MKARSFRPDFLAFFISMALAHHGSNAQTTEVDLNQPTAKQPNATEFERVQVTGSHIRKIDIEGVAPLDTISSDEIIKSGAIEINQVLREDPAFEAVYGNVGHVRFRGQHAGNVLILLNGLRMPKLDGGYYTSVRNLPTSAIGRVEMLKDGGSAVYGSDAMSGVMNFITKTDLDGSNMQASTAIAETGVGTRRSVQGTFGKNFSRGNIMGVFQYEKSDGFFETEVGSFSSRDGISPVKTSSARIGGNALKVGPTCADGSTCETDRLIYDQTRPDNEDISGMLTGLYTFGTVKASFLGLYNRKKNIQLENPARIDWTDQSGKGGDNNAVDFSAMAPSSYRTDIQNAGAVDGGFVDVNGNFVDELGDYVTEAIEDNYNLQAGLSGYIGMDWDWNVQSGISIADHKRKVLSGDADQNKLRELFQSGQFNILAPQGSKSDVSSAFINPTYRNRGSLFTNKVVFAGELFNLSDVYENGGPVSMALGTEFQSETFEFLNDQALVDGSSLGRQTRNFSGNRTVRSAFVEFAVYPVESLEVQLAGRFDSYSDVGETTNPKMAMAYRPIKEVLVRSSVSTGFRAPGITDIYAGEENFRSSFRDVVTCAGGCSSGLYDTTTYTTPDTKPETGLSYSFGTVVQPFKRTTISIDQWNFEGQDTLTALRASDYTEIEANEGVAGLDAVGATIIRDSNGDIESIRHPRVINLGQRTLRGVDVQIDSDVAIGNGFDFMAGNGFSFIFERSEQRFSFEDEVDQMDTWKNRVYVGLKSDYHFARLSMLTVSKQLLGRGRFETTLPSYSEFDLSYGYTATWGGNFNVAIKNLANTRPPALVDDYVTFGNPDRNYSSFSPLRRRVTLSYSQTF